MSLKRATFVSIAVLGLATTAAAQSPEEFYRGKNVTLVVGYAAGGGYDIYGRLLARHMGKYVPGKPGIIVQNMPGAGSVTSLEYLLNVAPKDGSTFGTFGRSLPMSPLLEGAKFDAKRLEWLGSITSDTSTCIVWHTTGVKNLQELKTKPLTFGGLAKGSDPDIFTTILRNSFGFPAKLVTGYPGTKDLAIALERGEIDGICGYTFSTIKASHQAWIADKKFVYLAQIGLARDKDLPDVPLLSELGTSDLQKEALRLISLSQTVARPFAMPPGTVADRLAAMRAAFMATMKDGEFLDQAKASKLEVDPYSGEQVAELFAKAYAAPKAVVDEAIRAIAP